MVYEFKIHSTDRNRSSFGAVEADDIAEAVKLATEEYKRVNPTLEVIHIEIDDTKIMPERRKQWAKENQHAQN